MSPDAPTPDPPDSPPPKDLADAPPRSATPASEHLMPGYDPVEGVPDESGEVHPPPGHGENRGGVER